MYKIYLWKANGIPKYVGSTKLKLTQRIQCHYSDKKSAIYKYMQEHSNEEFSYAAIDYADTKEEALLKESFWTDFYRERFSMLNIYNGSTLDENTKRKISEYHKGKQCGKDNPFYSKHHTEETKRQISEALKGKPSPIKGKKRSEEFKKKVSESRKGKLVGEKNPSATKVRIKETNQIFDTINECAEFLNVSRNTVSHSAHYNKKMRCGFTIEFIDIS